jgi:polysaccharide export outer membrane protein|tara:strand:- start:6628 stop:9222 length:2595 start_codon:yes stop_codon:yes gene_type:complete
MTKSVNSKSLRILLLIFFSSILFSQNNQDLDYLNLLPESQANSIAERLGIQTGKPINDEVLMEDFEDPSFDSMIVEGNDAEIIQETNTTNILETFGQDLFKKSPTTFAPIDLSPAPLEYVLGPGDSLKVQFFGSITSNRIVPVNREGNIVLPELGSIQVSGLTFNESRSKIESVLKASLVGVSAEISLSKIRSIQVFVLGNSSSPGAYTVSSLSNISNLLFVSGGPDQFGSLRRIDLKRNGELIGVFDFYDLLIRGNTNSDLKVQSNDVILLNPVGKTVSIKGEVKKPAKFELIKSENFSDLLQFASGFSNMADKNRITLSRIALNGERIYKNFNFEDIKNSNLLDGDEIFVHKISYTPRNIIKVKGHLSSVGDFAYEKNISLEDLISKESYLERTYTPFAIIERENDLGSKSLIKANLINQSSSKISLNPNDIIYILSIDDVEFLNSILVADALGLLNDKDKKTMEAFYSSSKAARYQCNSLKLLAKLSSNSSIKFVRSKYLSNPNINPVDQLTFIDSCPAIFEEKPYLIIFALENSSVISGEVRKPGVYPSYKVTSIDDLLSFAGGRTEKSSGKINIFSDEGISVDIDIKESPNLFELGVNSSFYANLASKINNEVFSVSLEGSFISPGIYGAKQGERLSDLIKRAGGYKKNAYPYGGVLARKSVAEKEKLAFLKSADQLEASIASAISSGRISSVGGDPSLALSSISSLITNLENIEPIGRIVAEFDLDLLERSPEKDLILEPGDRIFIPERPSTITVTGQVLSPTSFSFDPGKKVRNYISLAGGYAEDADKNRTLVIYPNGQASRVKVWPNEPDLAPGTTLIIPRDPNPFDWLVFSQVLFPIISNFATSAAAIAALGNNN